MVRKAVVNNILEILRTHSHLQDIDFEVSQLTGQEEGIRVQYRFDRRFFFQMKTGTRLVVQVNPGNISEQSSYYVDGISDVYSALTTWIDRVHEELLAVPVYRSVAEQAERLNSFIGQVENIPDEYFSREEAEEMKGKLSDLETKLGEIIKNSATDQAELTSQTEKLHKEIELLKATLESIKKPGWAGLLASRIFEWSKNPENQKILAAGAKTAANLMLHSGEHDQH